MRVTFGSEIRYNVCGEYVGVVSCVWVCVGVDVVWCLCFVFKILLLLLLLLVIF